MRLEERHRGSGTPRALADHRALRHPFPCGLPRQRDSLPLPRLQRLRRGREGWLHQGLEAGGVGGGVGVVDGGGVLARPRKGCGTIVAVDSSGKVAPSDHATVFAGGSAAPGKGGIRGSVPAVDVTRVPQPLRSSSPTDTIALAAEHVPGRPRDSSTCASYRAAPDEGELVPRASDGSSAAPIGTPEE